MDQLKELNLSIEEESRRTVIRASLVLIEEEKEFYKLLLLSIQKCFHERTKKYLALIQKLQFIDSRCKPNKKQAKKLMTCTAHKYYSICAMGVWGVQRRPSEKDTKRIYIDNKRLFLVKGIVRANFFLKQ